MEKIRVTKTEIWTYTPDLSSEFYITSGCTNLKAAMILDEKDIEGGEVSLEELSSSFPDVTYVWEVIDG